MSNWITNGDVHIDSVAIYLAELVDYDHINGRLRWPDDDDTYDRIPAVMKTRIRQGDVAGTTCRKGYDYEVRIGGTLRSMLPYIWEKVTGVCRKGIMTIVPGETRFSIDNLCMVPSMGRGKSKAPRSRARGKVVVSFSYERKQFTVVQVDDQYNKTVLSYHSDIEDAIDALKNPEVSFL